MTTFDGWNARLCGDAMALPNGQLSENELMHFRTKGSKNGVRRYQTESGEWTPLGLRERKKREGWGDKAEKRAAKAAKKLERRTAIKERRAAAKEAYIKKKAARSLKNLSDDELQRRINRVKKEIEYKELTKNPILKVGENLVASYFKNKDKKLEREMKKAELIVRQQEARTKLIAAKAAKITAKNNLIDTITFGAKRKQAKTQLINAKADKTIRGAIRGAIGGVIKKEGERIVKDMGDSSLVMKGGRKAKAALNNARDKTVNRLKEAYAGDHARAEAREKEKRRKRDREHGQELRG